MLKKAVQQGRSERGPQAYPLGYVEDLNDARTLHGKGASRRARVGRVRRRTFSAFC